MKILMRMNLDRVKLQFEVHNVRHIIYSIRASKQQSPLGNNSETEGTNPHVSKPVFKKSSGITVKKLSTIKLKTSKNQ